MSKRRSNEEKVGLSSVLRRGPVNLIAFGYVASATKCGLGWDAAINDFLTHFSLNETDIDPETIRREMRRMVFDYMHEGV